MERERTIAGYDLVDRNGRRVGRIEDVWEREGSDRPAFAQVKSGRLLGRTHVVPLMDAWADDESRVVQIPFTKDVVEDAPDVGHGDDLDPGAAERLWSHYLESRHGEQVEMPLYGERLDVHKHVVDQGGVRVRKELRREVVYEPVEVMREHVVVERLSPEELAEAEMRAQGRDDEFVLREQGEEPLFDATPEVIGGVRATRRIEHEARDVHAERRVEDVEVSRERLDREPGNGL